MGVTVPIDPPVNQPPEIQLSDHLGEDERDLYMRRYGSIRTHQRESRLGRTSYYNYRLPMEGTIEAFENHMRAVFERQAVAFKLNASIGAIMRHKHSGQLRYFHASANNYRLFPEPLMVQRWDDIEPLVHMTDSQEWTEHAANQMPNSSWQIVIVTNISLVVYHMQAHPIGGGHDFLDDEADDGDYEDDDEDDDGVEEDKEMTTRNNHGKNHGFKLAGVCKVPSKEDNLCVFHCIDMAMETKHSGTSQPETRRRRHRSAQIRFRDWWESIHQGSSPTRFHGILMQDLHLIENFYEVGFNVYTKDGGNAILLRRTTVKYDTIINVHMPRESHFDYIWNMGKYASSFVCRNCGQLWKRADSLKRHEATCVRASRYIYKGGPYIPRPRFFDLMAELGINVMPEDRFYEYRATYDLEACLIPMRCDDIYSSKHIPMSVSVASNVPGMEGPYCIISDGDPYTLVYEMIKLLCKISDEAYLLTRQKMVRYIDRLEELNQQQIIELNAMSEQQQKAARCKTSPLKRATDRLETWMRSLPVVSFNGSRYDLQLIKPQLAAIYVITDTDQALSGNTRIPRLLEEQSLDELGDSLAYILKKGNAITCFATRKLTFLDVLSYVAPGYSYKKYLETYGDAQDGSKSFWPYEYIDSLDKLNDNEIPKYDAFFSSLKQTNTLEEGLGSKHGQEQYRQLQELWKSEGMTSLRDLLVHYNNADVFPFLKALNRHVSMYRDMNLDMFKDAPSLPGLALRHGMEGLQGVFHTFGPSQADIAHLLADSMVGGPSLVFCRHAEANVTTIRTPEYGEQAMTCKSVFGLDANMLYPWAMSQDQTVGPCILRREPNYRAIYPDDTSTPQYSSASLEWLSFEAELRGISIQHGGNGPEVKIGIKHLPVDGYHDESKTVFQFQGCIYHGHDCTDPNDTAASWLNKSKAQRYANTEKINAYICDTCGYNLITIWECEWNQRKQSDRKVAEFMQTYAPFDAKHTSPPPDPGANMDMVLSAIREDRLFGMALVNIHTPAPLKSKFKDLPPIFKSAEVGRGDIGDHMRAFCEESKLLPRPRQMLISSYFANQMLIATPLLKWYLDMGLIVTRVYMVMQFDKRPCFSHVTENAANKRRAADKDSTQKLAGESAKLLPNSIYGKMCERKSRFKEVTFVNGPTASAAVCSPRFRDMTRLDLSGELPPPIYAEDPDMDPESMPLLNDMSPVLNGDSPVQDQEFDMYELSMAPRRIHMDLPVQIAFMVYAYAKLRMLQLRYDLFERYFEHHKWCPLYMDTDSYYIALAESSLHDAIRPEMKESFYREYDQWFPSLACEAHRELFIHTAVNYSLGAWYPMQQCCDDRHMYEQRQPGLFKTEFVGTKMIALSSKTYHCMDDVSSKEKLSSKGLKKDKNKTTLTYQSYHNVLMTRESTGGTNRGIKASPEGNVFTYAQPRSALTYLYAKRKVLGDGIHTEPLDL